MLFFLYTSGSAKSVKKPKLGFHQNSDESQIHGHYSNDDAPDLQDRVSKQADDISIQMGANKLEQNCCKTEIIYFSSRLNSRHIPQDLVRIGESNINLSRNVKN